MTAGTWFAWRRLAFACVLMLGFAAVGGFAAERGSSTVPLASIAITPATITTGYGTNLVETVTVTATSGTLDSGVYSVSASIVSGPGHFVGLPSCSYTGGGTHGSCTITISSTAPGTTVVHASASPSVGGTTVPVATDGLGADSGDGTITWGASIASSGPSGTQPDNTNAVLTFTVTGGSLIDSGVYSVTGSIVSGPGQFVGPASCSYTGGSFTSSCTLTITSASGGTTVVHATASPSVGGTVVAVATDGVGADSADVSVVWAQNASQQIATLLAAVNGVGPGNALTQKLQQVQADVAGSQTASACADLQNFLSLVAAQKGKKITTAQAASFTAQANAIRATLGC